MLRLSQESVPPQWDQFGFTCWADVLGVFAHAYREWGDLGFGDLLVANVDYRRGAWLDQ